jgi:hypothetical protein
LYRPGAGAAWVAQSNGDGTFTTVYAVGDNGGAAPNGIGGYDLLSTSDQTVALDFNGNGNSDLMLYRPGSGAAFVAESPDTALHLTINALLNDTDGSEQIQYAIVNGLPDVATLNYGVDWGNGAWKINAADFGKDIEITAPNAGVGVYPQHSIHLDVNIYGGETQNAIELAGAQGIDYQWIY